MSAAEELKEKMEGAREPFEKRVAATMAAIAAALAIVAVLGHLATTEELLDQQKAADQWSFFQARNIRRYESEIARDMLSALKDNRSVQYNANAERYRKETDEVQEKAREFEMESHLKGREALRLHFGEIFLEIAIVFASLAILTKRPILWWTAMAGGAAGCLIAASTLAIH